MRELLQIGANADATVHQKTFAGASVIAASAEYLGCGVGHEVSLLQLAVRAGNTTLARALVGAGAQRIGPQGVVVGGHVVPNVYHNF